ncbi:hypothetical protein [Candidatus Agathobaculum pullicola]|uniref:hypothetical protein n=1 Tax=Candidatus Agathobaculum pullicola TaxID=2838426 RepID=UPI003F93A5BF
MQGFYMLAMLRAKRQRRIALLACAAALISAFFAARVWFSAPAVPASTTDLPYIAQAEQDRLVVSRGGEIIIRTDIDVRSLPIADRQALENGILLSDAQSLARLLEDYGS